MTLVRIDLGKHTFYLHGQDKKGKGLFRKKLNRNQMIEFFATFHACTVEMASSAGAHYMARKLASFGHQVKLISPQFIRPFVVYRLNFVNIVRIKMSIRVFGLDPECSPRVSPQILMEKSKRQSLISDASSDGSESDRHAPYPPKRR